MHIGFIGAGAVAQAVARHARDQGHTVTLGSRRGPEAVDETVVGPAGSRGSAGTIAEAASAELVILAVPWLEVGNALKGLPAWNGRILVDATNPFVAFQPKLELADLGGRSASRIVAEHAPGARVVKAFNSVTMVNFEKGPRAGEARRVLFVSGDDHAAKTQVAELIEGFGYATVDLGDLDRGGLMQQAGGPLAGKDILLAA